MAKVVAETVGKTAELEVAGLPWKVPVRIIDVRHSYGTLQYQVEDAVIPQKPGKVWVAAYRVKVTGEVRG